LYVHAVQHLAKPNLNALYQIAEGQQELFTARQATHLGFKLGSQHHHVKMGKPKRTPHSRPGSPLC